jgi:ABC-2 type transport system ATP-binding protein
MIRLENVSKSYVKGKKAIDELSFEVKSGEIFGFIGPNGSGKSTTINIITGAILKDAGKVEINHVNIDTHPLISKKQFGYVSDNPEIFMKLRVKEYLNFLGDIYDVPWDLRKERITAFATKFEVVSELNTLMSSLSHGTRQKILIIGALIHDHEVWILDEPLTGLDPKSSFTLKTMMREHAQKGKTVFFSTHVLDVAEKLCDRVAIISKGKLIDIGTLEQIKSRTGKDGTLEQLFLELTENV